MRTCSSSRRSVIAALGAAATVAAGPSRAAAATGRPSARGAIPLRVGLIGCGSRGRGAAKNVIMADAGVTLVAVADVFPEQVRAAVDGLAADPDVRERVRVPEEHRFVGLDAYQKLLSTDVDYVVHATPPGFRPLHLRACIDAGKHVFVEKPVAVDGPGLRACMAIVAEAKRKGLAVGVGLQRHHDPRYLQLVDRLRGGDIGEILAARCYWNQGPIWVKRREHGWSDLEWQLRNWYYFSWLSGDHIVEQHIHNIDVINWGFGKHPVAAVAVGGRQQRVQPIFGHIYDHFAVDFEYPNDVHVMSMCRQIVNGANDVSEHLVGTKGRADSGDLSVKVGKKTVFSYDSKSAKHVDPYLQEHIDLIESIRKGKPLNELKWGTESNLAAVMGRMAAYTGKKVTWEQALNSKESIIPPTLNFKDKMAVPAVAIPGAQDVI